MIIRMHAYLYKFYNSFGNFLACIQDSVHTRPPLPNIRNAGYHPDNLKAKDLPLSFELTVFTRIFYAHRNSCLFQFEKVCFE